MINISLLRLFTKVADTLSIAAAARHLDISPSVASRQLYALERELKTKLLIRTTRKLTLTEAGLTLLEYARTTTNGFEQLTDELGMLQQKPAGIIKLSCSDFTAIRYLPTVLAKFCLEYPDIRLQLKASKEPTKMLDECDLALFSGRVPDEGLVGKRIWQYQRILCASRKYISRYGAPATIAELADHKCLSHSVHERSNWAFVNQGDTVVQTIHPYVESENFLVLIEFLLAGVGIARIASEVIKEHLESGEIVELLPKFRCVYPDNGIPGIWIVFPDRRMLHRTRLFADFLARELKF